MLTHSIVSFIHLWVALSNAVPIKPRQLWPRLIGGDRITNQAAFDSAVDAVSDVARDLLFSLTTSAEPRNREIEAEKARQRAAKRFGRPSTATG